MLKPVISIKIKSAEQRGDSEYLFLNWECNWVENVEKQKITQAARKQRTGQL